MKQLIYDLTYEQLEQWLTEQGEPAYRTKQLYLWLYQKRIASFEKMSDVPHSLRDKLKNGFRMETFKVLTKQTSSDGTVKFLLQLHDGHAIETVIMKHQYGHSVCVTTQVGCRIGCTFCASTLGGLKRDLTTGEITAQVVQAQLELDKKQERVSSIVVMGIGEPFENFVATMDFIKIINDPRGLHIGQRHITVSTSGIVPRIDDFADAGLQVQLAISIHAPNDELRSKLMPVNRRYPFADLIAACRRYIEKTGRRITFEYALMSGVNDQLEHAEQLADVLKGMLCHVNLIPVNPVTERNYQRTQRKDIFSFQKTLEKRGITTTIRREHGSDIDAACGQLRAKHTEQSR